MGVRISEAEKAEIWDGLERGESMRAIGRRLGRAHGSIRAFVSASAGKRPRTPSQSRLRLSLAEREEISRGLAAGESLRSIARRLGRSPSTMSREVARNGEPAPLSGVCALIGRLVGRARRPKPAKLAACPRLRAVVEAKLELRWSPQQISGWLVREFPDDPEMRVSHETIYLSLFVQSPRRATQGTDPLSAFGAHDPPAARPHGDERAGPVARTRSTFVNGPPKPNDRAVPGHWEGDLIYGQAHARDGDARGTQDAAS